MIVFAYGTGICHKIKSHTLYIPVAQRRTFKRRLDINRRQYGRRRSGVYLSLEKEGIFANSSCYQY